MIVGRSVTGVIGTWSRVTDIVTVETWNFVSEKKKWTPLKTNKVKESGIQHF